MSPSFAWFVFILDIVGLSLAFAMSSLWRFDQFSLTDFLSLRYLLVFFTTFLIFHVFDLYRLESQISVLRAPGRVIVAVLISGLCIVALTYLLGGGQKFGNATGRTMLLGSLSLFTVWAVTWRMGITHWMQSRIEKLHWLVFGNTHTLEKLSQDSGKNNNHGQFHALTPDQSPVGSSPNLSILGNWEDCEKWLNLQWAGIIVEETKLPKPVLTQLMKLRLSGVKVFDLVDFYEKFLLKVPIFYLKDSWFTMVHGFQLLHNPLGLRIKRTVDIILSIFLLVATLPFMILAALAIYLTSFASVIYTQVRVGEGGNEFVIYKFRTMVINAEKNGAQWAQPNDSRITFVGKILRLTRIDELPQLINVLKGEMSFIGPRPERPEIVESLKEEIPYYDLRHLVKPGITGWAQVLYRYGSSVQDAREKLQYDLFYIKNCSFLLDFAIILKTIRTVLMIRGR